MTRRDVDIKVYSLNTRLRVGERALRLLGSRYYCPICRVTFSNHFRPLQLDTKKPNCPVGDIRRQIEYPPTTSKSSLMNAGTV